MGFCSTVPGLPGRIMGDNSAIGWPCRLARATCALMCPITICVVQIAQIALGLSQDSSHGCVVGSDERKAEHRLPDGSKMDRQGRTKGEH